MYRIIFLVLLKIFNVMSEENLYPELNALYFEADMILNIAQQMNIKENFPIFSAETDDDNDVNRKTLWPNRVIFYGISYDFNIGEVKKIGEAIAHIEKFTCIRFRKVLSGMKSYLHIINDGLGCYSEVGFQAKKQILNLDVKAGCLQIGAILHQLLHTIGLFHQHTVYDRDNYIEILEDNITPSALKHFDLVPKHVSYDYDVGYDYESIMHFPLNAFSNDNKTNTMKPLYEPSNKKIAQRETLTKKDILKIQRMYDCVD